MKKVLFVSFGYFRLFLILFGFTFLSTCQSSEKTLHIYGSAENDIVRILQKQSIRIVLYNDVLETVSKANDGDGIIIFADNYPNVPVKLNEDFYRIIERKNLKAYIEFPDIIPGTDHNEISKAESERAVVTSHFFNEFPDSLSILGINGLSYLRLPREIGRTHIAVAKIAGFSSAIFGLPKDQHPLLIELNDLPVLVATTNLSRVMTGRYAPQKEWSAIWKGILQFVQPNIEINGLVWDPVVRPTYIKDEVLPSNVQRKSISRGIDWYRNARMLIPGSYEDSLTQLVENGIQKLNWSEEIPYGDGSYGVFECIFSEIDEAGKQPIGIMRRGDCISETAMAFATAGNVLNNDEYLTIANNLLDYYLIHSIATKKEYGDKNHSAYGLIPWGISNYAWYRASYGDDNARFLLAAWVTAALTGSKQWDEKMMKSLVALIRTTSETGFRGSRIDLPDLEKNGWTYYFKGEITNPSPHFECYLWACYLWAYDKTGEELFLNRAKSGISKMMDLYPDGWQWTNGLAQEKARMILPLAWLVRIERSPENMELLYRVVNDLLKLQDECGAIREELGEIEMGKYPPPQSNEAYGTAEASIIGQNGDPVSDLLYTTNFAFLGLHEASFVTNDPRVKQAVDNLAEFLIRIQVKSENHPELDGGWMRAFDFDRFEYWGSNADHGWGAWAIETGWTQGWITSILALRELNVSMWDLTKESEVGLYYPKLKKMLN